MVVWTLALPVWFVGVFWPVGVFQSSGWLWAAAVGLVLVAAGISTLAFRSQVWAVAGVLMVAGSALFTTLVPRWALWGQGSRSSRVSTPV